MTDEIGDKWDVYDQILIEVANELSGVEFDSEIEWTPELLEVKKSVMDEFKDKPHTTIDFVN